MRPKDQPKIQEITIRGTIRKVQLKGNIRPYRLQGVVKAPQAITFHITEYSTELEEIHW